MDKLKNWIVFVLMMSALGLSPGALAQTDMFDGKPTFAEGVDLGYYVWRDGDKWHVRWTTLGGLRRFSGSVVAEGGELKSLKRIDVEEERRVLYPGRAPRVVYGPRGRPHVRGGRPPVVVSREQDKIEKDGDHRIVFVARTNDDIDGFDFKVDKKVTSLRLVLQIDGQFRPQHVEVGSQNRKLPRLPFVVRLD
jgi:hypothetical protein